MVPLVEVTAMDEGGAEDLAMFGITSDDKQGLQSSTAYDGELNPMTFNHVKSSNAFASHKRRGFENHLSMIEEEIQDKSAGSDESDFSKWLAKSHQVKSVISKKSEDGWGSSSKKLNRAFSQ